MNTYKYSIGITSQLPFCSVPFRLDIYNRCQFSCAYCFAKARGGHRGKSSMRVVNTDALAARLRRVGSGVIKSTVDEFFSRRIPLQIGGMSDPFSPVEAKTGAAFAVLKLMKKYNYPILISTSTRNQVRSDIDEILPELNLFYRVSVVGGDRRIRASLQTVDGDDKDLLRRIEALVARGVAVGVRIQPIIPGFEKGVIALGRSLLDAGVRDVTFEYLKFPLEQDTHIANSLNRLLPEATLRMYRADCSDRIGRERVINSKYRGAGLKALKQHFNKMGFRVGIGDNDYMLFGDTESCCNSASLYLKGANYFESNIPGHAKKKGWGETIALGDIASEWVPLTNVGTYLNSQSRLRKQGLGSWPAVIDEMWESNNIYSPTFFKGVTKTGDVDDQGRSVYVLTRAVWDEIVPLDL